MLSVTARTAASSRRTKRAQEKLNEAVMMLNKNLQEINIQNMDTELVAQMFKNYQSNVLFHLEGMFAHQGECRATDQDSTATNGLKDAA
jgi:DASH complex subunit DAD4